MVSYRTILADLRRRPAEEVEAIRDQARQVVYGLSTSITALSHTNTFDRADAEVILSAANEVLADDGSGVSVSGTFGHVIQFHRSYTNGM